KIYKTDHAVQSIIVPAGNHKVVMIFKPASYYRYVRLASISLSIIYLTIILSLALPFAKKKLTTKG
ncbi:MAG: hypothetical protein GXO77_12280, partial [Calditrichaeota bacterium]|nr:hypothetical protein [Calditrichota bacterium]